MYQVRQLGYIQPVRFYLLSLAAAIASSSNHYLFSVDVFLRPQQEEYNVSAGFPCQHCVNGGIVQIRTIYGLQMAASTDIEE